MFKTLFQAAIVTLALAGMVWATSYPQTNFQGNINIGGTFKATTTNVVHRLGNMQIFNSDMSTGAGAMNIKPGNIGNGFIFGIVASGVNAIEFDSSIAASPVAIRADGTDSDITLEIAAKGTGNVGITVGDLITGGDILSDTDSTDSLGSSGVRWAALFTDAITVTSPLTVANGGTGIGTFTDGGILIGNGTGAIVALGVATNGQIPIGDGTTDPVLGTIAATANETTVANGVGTITIGIADTLVVPTTLFVNETSHASVASGVVINMGSHVAGGGGIYIKASDVAHGGVTMGFAGTEADDYFAIGKVGVAGGASIQGLCDGVSCQEGIIIISSSRGSSTLKSVSAAAIIEMRSQTHDSAGNRADVPANANLLSVMGRTGAVDEAKFIVDIDGDTWQDGTATFGTPLTVANGGTGNITLISGAVLTGNGTGGITNMGILGNGVLLIGDASGQPTTATLTPGTNIGIVNGAGVITINNTGSGTLDKDTSNTTVVSSTTETSIYSFSVPANTLGTDNMIRLTIFISDFDSLDTRTTTFRLKYGSTTMATFVKTSSGTQANRNGRLVAILVGDSATNSQMGGIWIQGNAAFTNDQGDVGTAAEDSTGALTLDVTVEHSINNASVSITKAYALLEVL